MVLIALFYMFPCIHLFYYLYVWINLFFNNLNPQLLWYHCLFLKSMTNKTSLKGLQLGYSIIYLSIILIHLFIKFIFKKITDQFITQRLIKGPSFCKIDFTNVF